MTKTEKAKRAEDLKKYLGEKVDKDEALQHYAAQKARLEKIKANLEKEIEYFAKKVEETSAEDPKDRFIRRARRAEELESLEQYYGAYWELRVALEQYDEYHDIF